MKLISMVDFVLQQKRVDEENDVVLKRIIDYAKFLKQSLELWMFIPCDENDNPIILPYTEKYMSSHSMYHRELNIYRKAKERVLFEGFEIIEINNGIQMLNSPCKSYNLFWRNRLKEWRITKGFDNYTVEFLATEGINLTDIVIKQLGLD